MPPVSGIPCAEMEREDSELSTRAHYFLFYRCNGTSRSRVLLPELSDHDRVYLSGEPRSALPEGALAQSLITVTEN